MKKQQRIVPKGRVAKPVTEKPKAQIQKENIPIKNNKKGLNKPVPVVNVASATVAAPITKEQNDVKEAPQDISISAKEMLDAQYPTPTNNNFDVNDFPIAGPGKPAAEEVVVPKTPAEDPSFKALTSSINANAKKQRKHEPAQSASKKAQKAAAVPSNERLSKAQASQVEVMEQQETGEFKASDFKEQLKSRIAEMELPKDEEAADKFKENNNLSEVKSAAMGDVKTAQDNAAGGIPEATSAAPNTASVPVMAVSPMPKAMPGKKPAMIPTAQAMPSKRSEASVEKPLQEETASLDTQMDQHGVTDTMLANSNEASFKSALDEKNTAKAQSKASVTSFRNTENQELNTAQQQSQQQVNATSQGMHTNRVAAFNKVAGNQKQSATQNTAARKQVADKIQGLYTETKTKVTSILSALDTAVASKFESGARAAQRAFENHIETNMKAYKEKRYGSSIFSWKQLRRVKDAFVGLPKEVNQFFESGRKIYIDTMDSYLGSIATLVANELNKAKRTIKEGKKSVQDYVDGLSPDLRKIGQQAASEIQSKFDSLEQDIDNKKDTLIDVLSQKYSEAVASVDTQIEALKEKNSGLINKAMGALKGVFDIIIKVKNTLTNLLANVVTAVGAIISDPIGFFKMLITGVGQGVQNFMTNIVQHLQSGLLGWLTGAMGSLSIQMPENIFSLKGIFSLTTQILGFTWSTIRTVGVKVVGEPIVKALETGFEMVQILREKGIAGLWEHLKEQFQDLKETVIGAIKDMLMSQVIQAGIKWILGLLSPVVAFVKAIMAIIDVVKFFIQRASQIAELVSAFTESIAAIAAGKVGAVAKSIENALGKAVPVVIGLLASVLGIGGLANKVLGIVRKIRKRVEKALFSLWTKIKNAGRKIWKKLGFGKKKKKKEEKNKSQNKDLHVGEEIHFKAGNDSHELWFNEEGKGVTLWVASNDPKPVLDKLDDWKGRIKDDDQSDGASEKRKLIKDVKTLVEELELDGAEVEDLIMQQEKSPKRASEGQGLTKKQIKQKNDPLKKKELAVSKKLTRLFELYGEQDQIGGKLPEVGIHPLKGEFRESHHVAENSFMEQIKEFYGVVGKKLEKDNSPFNDLGVKLVARSESIETKFKDGKNLSAILLHRETHRTAKDKAVHATGLQKEVQDNIEDSAYTDKKITVLGVKSDGIKRAQMFEGDWKSFILKVYSLVKQNKDFNLKESDNEVIIKSKKRDKDALNKISNDINEEIKGITKDDKIEVRNKKKDLLKKINNTAMTSYDSALNSGLQTVKTALSKSTFDGDNEKHSGILDALNDKAEEIWKNDIINKIT